MLPAEGPAHRVMSSKLKEKPEDLANSISPNCVVDAVQRMPLRRVASQLHSTQDLRQTQPGKKPQVHRSLISPVRHCDCMLQ